MTSVIGSFYTLSACVDQAPLKYEEWLAVNPEQEAYLKIYDNRRGAKIPEIESIVSIGDVNPVNKFLSDRGFDIHLDPIEPDDLAIASVLELIIKWLTKGDKTTVNYMGDYNDKYKAVHLEEGVNIVYDNRANAIAMIQTKNGDTIYITMPKIIPKNSFEVLDMARDLISTKKDYSGGYYLNKVVFPMIDLDVKPDISWIIGMCDRFREKWVISQALQQTKVKIDEEGVVVREAVAMTIRCCSMNYHEPEPLVINKPFLFVIKREGLKEPLFSAYLDIDSWIR